MMIPVRKNEAPTQLPPRLAAWNETAETGFQTMRHGGQIVIDQLALQGVQHVFTVPGESFLAALDGLHEHPAIRTIVCRHEGGAAMMAEAMGKLTGQPGICFVTRGPGLANAMAGLHVAQQDSTPLIAFVGLPARAHENREAFQEVDLTGLMSTFVKWTAVIGDVSRIPEYVSRAFHIAQSGRPGPVVLGLPEDMLRETPGAVIDARPATIGAPAPPPADMARLVSLIEAASKPLMIIGGPGWSAAVAERIAQFAARFDLPVACSFRCQDYIDNRLAQFVGHVGIGPAPALARAVREADLLIVIGARLGEMTTSGYSLLDSPNPVQKLVHVHPDGDELGTVFRPDLPIIASAANFVQALSDLNPPPEPPWRAHRAALRRACEDHWRASPTPGAVQLEHIVQTVSDNAPDDTIICNGAGNYAAFVNRYFVYKRYRTQLAPTSGSMGYGLPAGVAAKLAFPDRPVIAFAGDGCAMMSIQELATMVRHRLPVVVIIANNGMYGTIRMHQELSFPGRVSGTDLTNPDFAALARSFGMAGVTVTDNDQFLDALRQALALEAPSLLELQLDPQALTPGRTLSQIRDRK